MSDVEGVETSLLDVDDLSEVGNGDGLAACFEWRPDNAETNTWQLIKHSHKLLSDEPTNRPSSPNDT